MIRPPTPDSTLHELLAAGRRFSGSYGGGLANHLPMALVALQGLGAEETRLREFASFYEKRLRAKAPAENDLRDAGWLTALSRPECEAAVADVMEEEIAGRGAVSVLSEVLPRLTPGLGSAAFHGLIRTAYAVDSGDDADLPDALSYWIVTYHELPPVSESTRFASAAAAFNAMHGDTRFENVERRQSIDASMAAVTRVPAFTEYCGPVRDLDLAQFARIAVSIYLATADFTALHLVTACHATRILKRYLSEEALNHLLIAMLAAYGSLGRPAFDVQPRLTAPPDRASLAARAIESNDDHDLKLVYSALREESVYGWGLHHAAASRRLSKVKLPDF
jgi:hypothetical protein